MDMVYSSSDTSGRDLLPTTDLSNIHTTLMNLFISIYPTINVTNELEYPIWSMALSEIITLAVL